MRALMEQSSPAVCPTESYNVETRQGKKPLEMQGESIEDGARIRRRYPADLRSTFLKHPLSLHLAVAVVIFAVQ
jgi:hypothetical protein